MKTNIKPTRPEHIMDDVKRTYENKEYFALDIYGTVYWGTNPYHLEFKENIQPLIVGAKDHDTIESFIDAIQNSVAGCMEYIDYCGYIGDNRIFDRYNSCDKIWVGMQSCKEILDIESKLSKI